MKNILNKVFWDKRENPDHYNLSFIHRGAPEDLKTISLTKICEVGNSWFTYEDNAENGTTIPFHRVTLVKNIRSGNVLWRKKDSE